MVSGIEGVGEAVTGSMIARAVEPQAGEDGHTHETSCLNCGAELRGDFCHRCGQKAHVHRTLTAFFHDLVHGVLHFEGKIWRTLPLLAWRPGDVTRRYIDGERARFVSPMALFLFSVFLMFAVFSLVGGPFEGTATTSATGAAAADLQAEFRGANRNVERLEAQRRALIAAGRPTTALDVQLAEARQERLAMAAAQRIVAPGVGPNRESVIFDPSDLTVDTGFPRVDAAIRHAAENPSLLAYKLQTNAYKFSWALIPLSVPFVWLLFLWRRQFKLYDHVIFVTYSIASMTLLVVALSLVRPIVGGDGISGLVLTFYPPFHMYRQLRGAYGLSRFRALWRTVFLLFFAIFAATLFFLLLLTVGLLG